MLSAKVKTDINAVVGHAYQYFISDAITFLENNNSKFRISKVCIGRINKVFMESRISLRILQNHLEGKIKERLPGVKIDMQCDIKLGGINSLVIDLLNQKK